MDQKQTAEAQEYGRQASLRDAVGFCSRISVDRGPRLPSAHRFAMISGAPEAVRGAPSIISARLSYRCFLLFNSGVGRKDDGDAACLAR